MSPPDDSSKAPVTVAWKTLARVADEAAADPAGELAAMSDEAIDAELAAAGLGSADVEALAQLARGALFDSPSPAVAASPAAEPLVIAGSVDRPRRPPRPRARGFAIVTAMAACASLLVWQRPAIVAFFAPAPAPLPIGPDIQGLVPAPQPLARQAAKVREQALAACASQSWVFCQDELDRASELDPAGDAAPAVKAARAQIAAALSALPPPHAPSKPPAPRPSR